MKHIKGLDTLRAFAVFFVIIEHFGVWFDYTSPSGKFITIILIPNGGFGVFLFFVLSGFLITSILLKARETNDVTTSRIFIIKNFFIRRALRIFPVYYFLLFVLLIAGYPDIRHYFWYFATYTSNILSYRTNSWNTFSHTWTLSVEEQFYLIWPWLIIMINRKYIKYVFIISILTGIVSTYISMVVQRHMAPLLVINSFDAFGIGGLYAWMKFENRYYEKAETGIKMTVIAALIVYFYWKISALNNYPAYGLYMEKTVDSIIAIWLIMMVINNRSGVVRKFLLENRFLNFIGKISYGIYLYHYVYIQFLFKHVNSFLYNITLPYPSVNKTIHDHHTDYWIELSMIILISAISYILIEKPLLNLKKYFRYNDG